jgi:hypothetical protein
MKKTHIIGMDMWLIHRKGAVEDFCQYLSSIHPVIKFMMELEQVKTVLFQDILVRKTFLAHWDRLYTEDLHPLVSTYVLILNICQHRSRPCSACEWVLYLDKEIDYIKEPFKAKWVYQSIH